MEEGFRIFFQGETVENPVVLEAFPGIGLVGGIASTFMIDKLNMEFKGHITSKFLPPVAMLKEGLAYPPLRIYTWRNIILLHSDVPIHPHIVHDLSRSIAKWSREIGAEKVISLAGVAMPFSTTKIYGAANTPELLEFLRGYGVEILQEGAIGGVSGQLLLECSIQKVPALSLLAETSGMNPDPRASAELLKVLSKMLDFEIDVTPLIEEAESIEAKMEELAKQTREMKKEVKELPMFY